MGLRKTRSLGAVFFLDGQILVGEHADGAGDVQGGFGYLAGGQLVATFLQQGQCSSMDAGISPASPKPGAEHGDDGVDSPARSHRRSCRCPGWRSPLPAVSIALARMLPLCDSREGINIVGKSAARIHHCPPAGWQGRHLGFHTRLLRLRGCSAAATVDIPMLITTRSEGDMR